MSRVEAWLLVVVGSVCTGMTAAVGCNTARDVELRGRCIEACAPKEYEAVVRGAQCLCKGSGTLVELRSRVSQ